MVRPEVLRRRLEKLDEYLSILVRMRRYSRREFLAEPEHYGAAERFLQLSIETIDDLAGHVVADEGWGSAESPRDLAHLFRRHGLVNADLESRWTLMIGFRNVLVHEYVELDREIVYDVLQNRLDDIRALQRVFAEFL